MLRLKEQPAEWIKFTAVIGLAVNVVVWLLWHKDRAPLETAVTVAVLAVAAVGLASVRPRWFRGFYRGGMTVSFHIGQVMGKVLLTILFFLVVTPMTLLLRLLGKDLLELKQQPGESTRWRMSRSSREFDRMF